MTTSKLYTIFIASMIVMLIFMFIIHIATEKWHKLQSLDTQVIDHSIELLK